MVIFLSGITLLIIAAVIFGILYYLLNEFILEDEIGEKIAKPLYIVCAVIGIGGILLVVVGCIKFIWWFGLGFAAVMGAV